MARLREVRLLHLALAGAAVVMLAVPAVAQDGVPADDQRIEEVVVTATYRETNLMDTPLAISAVTDSLVEDLAAQSMEDIYTMIPGLSMQGSTDGQARYTIRGITSQSGNIQYAPAGATVGVYLDGTPVTAALGPDNQVSGTLFDIERVEVLKGPQGTLFGEGSQGGTIRYLYKQPDPTRFGATVNGGLARMAEASDPSMRLDGMVNVPLNEELALRLTGWRSRTAGYIDNLEPFEEDFNEAGATGVRATLRYEGDSFTVTGGIYRSSQKTEGGVGTARAYEGLFRRIPGVGPESEDDIGIYSLNVDVELGWATFQSMTSHTDRQISAIVESTSAGVALLDFYYGGSTLAADHPECASAGAAFGICPGWIGVLNFGGPLFTPDGNNLQAISQFEDHYSERWVQEFRLLSPAEGRLRWTIGAFWKDSEDHTQAQQRGAYYPGREAFGERFDPLLMVPANTHTDFLEEFAAFGEASYDLTQTLELTAGVRVSNLKQHFTNTNTGTDDTPVSPKLVLSWRPLDGLLVYARYGTGFRPGNVNNNLEFYAGQFEQSIQDVMNSTGLDEATRQQRIASLREMIANSRSRLFFDGDTLDSYELGLKSALWDGRMALLASAYYIDWKDMLVYVADPAIAPGGDIHNANSGGADIRGFELEVTAFITERFNVRLAGDVNDTEVTESAAFSRSGDGAELIYAPNYSASVALDYSLPITGGWTIDFHVDRAWVAEQFSNAQNTLEIPSYEKSNGRVTLRSPGGPDGSKWRVALYGTNLENEEILRGRTDIGTLYWHSPRQIGVEVGYRR